MVSAASSPRSRPARSDGLKLRRAADSLREKLETWWLLLGVDELSAPRLANESILKGLGGSRGR